MACLVRLTKSAVNSTQTKFELQHNTSNTEPVPSGWPIVIVVFMVQSMKSGHGETIPQRLPIGIHGAKLCVSSLVFLLGNTLYKVKS